MNIRYVGPYDVVEIAATGQVCDRGGTVDVDDELAERLLEQPDNWQADTKSKPKPAPVETSEV